MVSWCLHGETDVKRVSAAFCLILLALLFFPGAEGKKMRTRTTTVDAKPNAEMRDVGVQTEEQVRTSRGMWGWLWSLITRTQPPPLEVPPEEPDVPVCEGTRQCAYELAARYGALLRFLGFQLKSLLHHPFQWTRGIKQAYEEQLLSVWEVRHETLGFFL